MDAYTITSYRDTPSLTAHDVNRAQTHHEADTVACKETHSHEWKTLLHARSDQAQPFPPSLLLTISPSLPDTHTHTHTLNEASSLLPLSPG